MGELINLNPFTLTDSDIPAAIARDAEYIAADTAHINAPDPHPQYATQARADERYGLIKKFVFTGITPNAQGEVSGIGTNLNSFKIVGLSGVVQHSTNGSLVGVGHTLTPGYEFALSTSGGTTGAVIYIGTVATKSANILSKPFRIVVDYSLS